MSEYQYVGFRAIDEPVSKKHLDFMEGQTSHAKSTPWTFDVEYDGGDFRGNAREMLRRGYDVHLHYANFGIRTLMIRLPSGLPYPAAAKPYFVEKSLEVAQDKKDPVKKDPVKKDPVKKDADEKDPGGTLIIEAGFESGQLEELWNPSDFLERLLPLRAEILNGDLRPLYLANLAVAGDINHDPDEWQEPPVPAGLDQLTAAQTTLAEFYGLGVALVAAAARNTTAMPAQPENGNRYDAWLAGQPETVKNEWLATLMADPEAAVRSQLLRKFRESQPTTLWPTAHLGRTMAELTAAAEEIEQAKSRRKAAATTRGQTRRHK